ncbi:MAG: AP2 domain-containing protein [Oscillochloris sp.]|nr:AP2 domain-containing protein [Oscillochloris sp.]
MSDDPRPPFNLPPGEAISVRTEVICERGQWAVYLEVEFPHERRRFWIDVYRSEQRARIAAEYIRRYADQDSPFPQTGL